MIISNLDYVHYDIQLEYTLSDELFHFVLWNNFIDHKKFYTNSNTFHLKRKSRNNVEMDVE